MIKAINIFRSDRKFRLEGFNFQRVKRLAAGSGIRTPFLILSRSIVRSNLAKLARALPGVAIHYAVKSNNHRAILEEVSKTGHSFDIASYEELRQAGSVGGHVNRFIHSHPIKSVQEIDDAVRAGTSVFVVDNGDEIDKFVPYAGRVQLLIRFKVDGSSAVVNLSYKFGCEPIETIQLAEMIRKRGLTFHGLTFHVGSQCTSSSVYINAIETAFRLINELRSRGFKTKLLDIGGGFPVPYTDSVPSISRFCKPISRILKDRISPETSLACEPGRFISAPAVTLVASIIGKSKRSGKHWYFLDDGLYGSFSGRLYDHCSYQVLTNRNTTWKQSVLAGPTCDSFDVIYKDILLPPLEVGDLLIFPAMGAYCSVSASTFNSLKKAEYIVID